MPPDGVTPDGARTRSNLARQGGGNDTRFVTQGPSLRPCQFHGFATFAGAADAGVAQG